MILSTLVLSNLFWAIPWGFLAGFGLYNVIVKLIEMANEKVNKKTGKINFEIKYEIEKSVQGTLDEIVEKQSVTGTSNGIAGKVVSIGGKPAIVLSIVIINVDSSSSTFDLIYYREGKIGRYRVDSKHKLDSAERYFKESPVRSRAIRRDVRTFCNSSCILDCQDCILHKYGKPKGVSKPGSTKKLPKL